jgi:hypothetical protein
MANIPLFGIRVPATILGGVFLAMTGLAWQYYRRALHDQVAGILGAGMLVILASASLFLLPAIERLKLSPKVAAVIQLNSAASIPVATCGYGEPSLNFYLGRGPITPIEGPDLARWAAAPGKGILVVTESRLFPHLAAFRSSRIRMLDIINGFNYSQGKQVRIHILYRNDQP